MNHLTQQRLLQINQDFYNRFAAQFASTRFGAQPGWEQIIPYFPRRCQALDLGCGNGRFAGFLDERLEHVEYTGLDGSARLVELARQRGRELTRTQARFQRVDLAQPGWEQPLRAGFDLVAALAVLHHIPSFAARAAFVQAAAACLNATGILVLSNWRFTQNARMRRKITSWAAVGLSDAEVEPGDYLLDWKAGASAGFRYAHQVEEVEIAELARLAELAVIAQFHADGHEGDLSLYSLLRKIPLQTP